MTKFKVGDKVRIELGALSGMIGKIVRITSHHHGCPYIVLFDENVNMLERYGSRAKELIKEGYDYRKCWIYGDEELELVEEKKMENVKSLLKSGDIVVFGSGDKAKVFLDYDLSLYHGKGILAYIEERSYMVLSDYNDDLFTSSENEHYAINKIYRPKHDRCVMSNNLYDYDLIWERKEIKEMTMKEICDALGYEVKIKKED